MRSLLFLLIAAVFRTNVGCAWDMDGHQAIGMTAMSNLKAKATVQVKRLMGGKDIVDVAGWALKVVETYPETASYHFGLQPTKGDCSAARFDEITCPDNKCIVKVLQHFYGRLTNRPDLVKLKYPKSVQFTDSDAVKFLINLIGDLHQPLHVGFREDMGGMNITLSHVNSQRVQSDISMFDYWDSGLIQKFIAERPSAWYGGWTHAHSLGEQRNTIKKEWDNEPSETKHLLFEKWATESLQKACNEIYKDPRSQQPIPSGYIVTGAYDYQSMELCKTQILVAGTRISFVLNTILAERDAGKLRQGSAVEIALEEHSGSLSKRNTYLQGFAINFVIIVAVLGLFLYFTRYYAPTRSATPAPRASRDSHKRS